MGSVVGAVAAGLGSVVSAMVARWRGDGKIGVVESGTEVNAGEEG